MKSAYQNVINEVKNLKSIEEAIALAIEREKEAKDFYMSKAALMDNPKFKELYEHLANEEVKHLGYLEEFRDKTELPVTSTELPSGQSFTPEFNSTQTKEYIMLHMHDQQTTFPPEFDTARTTGGEATLGDAGILLAALRHERKSEYFYLEVAKKVEDESLIKFFEMLAGYERGHYELIDSFLEEITSFRMQT